ncbi:MAG: hypothetical protein PHT92_03095 [Bacteroidales bacterium]|nr:hypothetical protein [Bacteroidales bacterium]
MSSYYTKPHCIVLLFLFSVTFSSTNILASSIEQKTSNQNISERSVSDSTANEKRITRANDYNVQSSFLLVDKPARLYTMRQYSQNYFGAYLLAANSAHKNFKFIPAAYSLLAFSAILGMPLTHEEGHRSVLTYKNIGSISRPYFNDKGAAYVQGVTDQTLIDFRNSDLTNYIRLHTAGLESDYMLSKRAEMHMAFNPHNQKLLYFEYFMRKGSLMQYYLTGLFKYDFDLVEETDELKRDIVGHDVYGAVRHIHQPEMEFKRYIQYEDLNKEERSMIKRIGWRSLLNLASPFLIFKDGFTAFSTINFNFSLGYTMSPFGDFIDQNIWLKINENKYKIYLRQHQNKHTWFPAAGVGLFDFQVGKKFLLDTDIHIWQQPVELSFTETDGFWGGAFDFTLRYLVNPNLGERLKRISVDLGVTGKTKGFMPEEMELDKSIGCRFGLSIYY